MHGRQLSLQEVLLTRAQSDFFEAQNGKRCFAAKVDIKRLLLGNSHLPGSCISERRQPRFHIDLNPLNLGGAARGSA